MKAALLVSPGTVSVEEVPLPQIEPGHVMIQPVITGVCGTDLSFYAGRRVVPYPFVLGHELLGHITAVGAGVTKFKPGQRVIVEPNYPCGSCRLCRTGRGAVCPDKKSMGVNVPGCFALQATAPAEFVWAIPDSISDRDAATIEPLAVSVHGLLKSGVKSGDTVAVLGCGVVGLLLIHAAVARGVRVIAHDRLAGKLQMARDLGAVAIADQEELEQVWNREEVVTVFECAGTSATVELALKSAPRGAEVILLGLASAPASFIPMRIVREGVDIRTSMIYDHPGDFEYVIDLVAKGTLHPGSVVTHTYSFDSIATALNTAGSGEAGKVHVAMK